METLDLKQMELDGWVATDEAVGVAKARMEVDEIDPIQAITLDDLQAMKQEIIDEQNRLQREADYSGSLNVKRVDYMKIIDKYIAKAKQS